MFEPIYRKMTIANLLLNPDNPRFDPVEHQLEAISAMVSDQQGKLVALAQHIAKHGLNPTAPVLVKPYDNNDKQWVVREGNRRITALKLMNEPSLVPSDFPKLKKEFQQLNSSINIESLQNIPCVVLEDEDQINEWVGLAHTGENNGVWTVGWDGQQTSRFRAIAAGKTDTRLAFLDELRHSEAIPQSLKDRFVDIRKTNFDRLMDDPDVREFLGVSILKTRLRLVGGVTPYLLMVINDLAFGKLSVGAIYMKSDREKYIEFLRQRDADQTLSPTAMQPPSGTENSYGPAQEDSDNPHAETATSPLDNQAATNTDAPRKLSSYPIGRKSLIPRQDSLVIPKARILRIFNELRSLSVGDYPNAVAVLFRTFVELSADYYISQHSLIGENLNAESKLQIKIDGIANYMEKNGTMNKNGVFVARQMTSSPTQNHSLRAFHSYVHNMNVTPSSGDLKTAWEDIWPFVQQIWK